MIFRTGLVYLLCVFVGALLLATPANAEVQSLCGEAHEISDALDGRVSAICGLNQPEDFAITPDGRHIIVGDLGMAMTPQGLRPSDKPVEMTIIDTATDRVGRLPRVWDKGPVWGDASCKARDPAGPFFALGMHVSTRSPGTMQLLVVNTIGGAHVDFFELKAGGKGMVAAWRGCVDAADQGMLDAVAALPDGGFVASILCRPGIDLDACIAESKRRENTGWLVRWTPKQGLHKLANSEALLNNGLEVSQDGQEIYSVVTGAKQLKVYSLAAGRYVHTVDLGFAADNARMANDGTVIVGGVGTPRMCLGKREQGCVNESLVMAIDPRTGRRELLFYADEGLLSGTTGGIRVGDYLYVSSLSDPYLLKVRLGR